MAVKARATVTLASIKDVASTTRYYLLQSSTVTKPAKPTTNPPGGSWAKTEPSYTAGSTNSLYFTDLTVFSDDSFAYSDVSLSSSYEAAKTAYNEAIAARSTAQSAETKINNMIAASEIIVGTQTEATGSWTGLAGFVELADGQQIAYWLPYAGSGNASLTLTLSDGSTTDAIPVYYRGSTRATTHFAAGSVIHLTYRVDADVAGTAYTGWWADASYDSGNTYNRIKFENAVKAKAAISASRFIVGDGAGYRMIAGGVVFDITKPILWAASAISSGKTGTNNYLAMNSLTLRNNLSGITLTQYETCYLVGTLEGKDFTVKSSAFFTSTVPTEEDGFYYIALGYLYSTYQIYLYPEHPIYRYVNGAFMSLDQVAYEAAVTAADAKEGIDNLEIGGRNLFLNSSFQKDYDQWAYDAEPEIVTVDGRTGCHISQTALKTNRRLSQSIVDKVEAGQTYTISGWFRSENITQGTTNFSLMLYMSGTYIPEGGDAIASFYPGTKNLTVNAGEGTWEYVSWTLTFTNKVATATNLRFYVFTRDMTGDLYFSHLKLEKGNRATDWTPAPEDTQATITETADQIRTYAESILSQKADEIEISISTVTGTIAAGVEECKDSIAATDANLESSVNTLNQRVTDQEDDLLAYKNQTSTYFRFNTNGLNIGKQVDGGASPYAINIDNEKMAFLQNGMEVAYVQYNKLHINAVEAIDRMSVGAAAHGGYFDFVSTVYGMGVKWRAVHEEEEEDAPVPRSIRAMTRALPQAVVQDDEGIFKVDFGGEKDAQAEESGR